MDCYHKHSLKQTKSNINGCIFVQMILYINGRKGEWTGDCSLTPSEGLSHGSWQERVIYWRNDDDVRYVHA